VNPIPEREKANRYFLTLLALKLIEKTRRYDIKYLLEDGGLARFTGGDTLPSSSSLHSFNYGMKEAALEEMKRIYIEILRKYMDFSVLHMDFHTTPHFGESKEMETNHIATLGKNMKGALIFLIQDRESRIFPYSNANVKRSEASDEIKINFDTFLTQIAHALYRLMAKNLRGYESAEPETLYK
jgi:hypothetical protein